MMLIVQNLKPHIIQNFIDSVSYRAQDLGRLIGVSYAEGFNVERL